MKKYIIILSLLLTVCLCGCTADFGTLDLPFLQFFQKDPIEETTVSTEPTYAPLMQAAYLDTYVYPENEKAMDYHMYIPKDATEHMPLIVYLHGVGDVGSAFYNKENPVYKQALAAYGESFPFLILAPSSMSNESWLSRKMPERVKSLIEHIAEQYNVDRDKIIITGHSMGATGVFRQIEMYSDFYSAAIPISAPDISIFVQEKCLDIPIWGFAGSQEHPCSYDMEVFLAELNEMGGNAKFTELEGVNHGKAPYHAYLWDVFEWAIAQSSGE